MTMNKKYILICGIVLALLVPITLFVMEATLNPPEKEEVPPYETCETLDPNGFYIGACIFGLKSTNVCNFHTVVPSTWRIPITAPIMTYQPFFVKTTDMPFSQAVDCSVFRAYNAKDWSNSSSRYQNLAFDVEYHSKAPEGDFALNKHNFFETRGRLEISNIEKQHKDAILGDIKTYQLGTVIDSDDEQYLQVNDMILADVLFLRQFQGFDKTDKVQFISDEWTLTFKKEYGFF